MEELRQLDFSPRNALDLPISVSIDVDSRLRNAITLHMLITQPHRVLPPDKTLASIFATAATTDTSSNVIERQVSRLVKGAFWKEVHESFSSENPGVVMDRIKLLYNDLHSILEPLLPPLSPSMVLLRDPLSPTTSPLRSTLNHVHSILVELRQRCAPARDRQVDALIEECMSSAANAEPVRRIIELVFQLVEDMKQDARNFTLVHLGEPELRSLLRHEAIRRERELVLDLYQGTLGVRQRWKGWIHMEPLDTSIDHNRATWVAKLMRIIGMPNAITFSDPSTPSLSDRIPSESTTSPSHVLPPPFLVLTPTLFHIQNLMQAVTISSCLRLILPRPPPPSQASTNNTSFLEYYSPDPIDDTSFILRIWALLNVELERGGHAQAETKLVNLEDEVVRVAESRTRRRNASAPSSHQPDLQPPHWSSSNVLSASSSPSSNPPAPTTNPHLTSDFSEALRSKTRLIVNASDPTFKLLLSRVTQAITERLCASPPSSDSTSGSVLESRARAVAAPLTMRAGRNVMGAMRGLSRFDAISPGSDSSSAETGGWRVKGFEDIAFEGIFDTIYAEVLGVVEWVEEAWGDVI